MTLPLLPLLLTSRIRRVTLAFASLLLLVLFTVTACDSTGSDSSPVTPQPPSTPTTTPTPPPAPPPPTPPDTPTGLRVVGSGATENWMFLDLEWDAVPDAALYRLDVDWDELCRFFPDRLEDNFSHEGLAQRDKHETEFDLEVVETKHRALLANQQQDYCFRVRAENSSGDHSPWSATIIGRTVEADANHTPHGFEMRTLDIDSVGMFLGGFVNRVTWQPVAGAYGYVTQHNARAVSREPWGQTKSGWNYSPDRVGNWSTNRGKHGCVFEVRACTLYDKEAALEGMGNRWTLRRDESRRSIRGAPPVGCSEWSEVQEFTIEIPGEGPLPVFSCR